MDARKGLIPFAQRRGMKDLTKGNPFQLILFFFIPVFLGNEFQALYNMVDTIVVGNTVSSAAFTGVGLTGPITFLVLGFVSGLTAGFSVRIAQEFGAGDEVGVRRAVAMSFLLCAGMCVLLTALALPLAKPLLRLMQTPDQYFDYSYAYLFVIFGGLTATIFYNMVAATLRAIGDSATPLLFLIVAAVLNIGLDFFFIVGLKLYYHGAALATVVSQLLSGGACLLVGVKKYRKYLPGKGDWKWNGKLAGGHIAIGLPMALQFSITAIGCMIQQTALNGLDKTHPGVITAYTAASKIDNLATQTFAALGTAMATYAGQNFGAGRLDRVRQGVRVGMIYTLLSVALGLLVDIGLYEPLMGLFLNVTVDPSLSEILGDVMAYGKEYLLWQSGNYLFLGIIFIYRNTLQGIGKSLVTMLAGVTELAGRILTAFVFVRLWGFDGLCLSNPIAWIAADLFLLATYFVTMRKCPGGRAPCGGMGKKEVCAVGK